MADANPLTAASVQPSATTEPSAGEAIKRLPKGTKVTLPELDDKGERAFVRDAASGEVPWMSTRGWCGDRRTEDRGRRTEHRWSRYQRRRWIDEVCSFAYRGRPPRSSGTPDGRVGAGGTL
jgi:hypothetical protein